MPPRPNKPSSNKLYILIGVGALALIILGIGAGVVMINRNNPIIDPPGPITPTPSAEKAKASDAVRGYLEALAAGDAEAALSFGETQPADKTFLTDEALAASNKIAPITEITVPESEAYSVDVSYKIGERHVNDSYYVSQGDDDAWKLTDTFAEVNLSGLRFKTLPLSINGTEVTADEVRLFPGTYVLGTGTPNISYGPDGGTMIVDGPQDYPSTSDLSPMLTETGRQAFLKATKASLNACLKVSKLDPPGCPFGLTAADGQKFKKGSIRWELTNDPLADLEPRLDYEDPATASTYISMDINFNAKGTQNGRSASWKDEPHYFSTDAVIDLTSSKPKVVWQE